MSTNASNPIPFSPEEIASEGLKPGEYDEIFQRLGRHPNRAELGMFGVMWSEHCCYKNSRPLLKQFPTEGPRILVGPGENAGVVDVGHGQRLVFIEQNDCTQPITQDTCYTLMHIDFQAALHQPQPPEALLHCQNSMIDEPVWIDNQHIAMLQKEARQWRLVRYSVDDGQISTLYEINDGNILYFSFSNTRQTFAVTAIKADGLQYIEHLSLEGDVLSSQQLQLGADVPQQLLAWPAYAPHSDAMLTGFNGQLFSLSAQGKVQKANTSFGLPVGVPHFHPSGERLLLITGRYDSDVATMPLPSELMNAAGITPHTELVDTINVFKRSIEMEDYAKFQPHGGAIAYVSEQTGTEQVWLFADERAKVLSQFPKQTTIRNIFWDTQGQHLLVLANYALHIMALDGQMTRVQFPYSVTQLFHWDSEQQRAIATMLIKGIATFVDIDLRTLQYTVISHQPIRWAAENTAGTLLFLDERQRIWQRGNLEHTLVAGLNGQGSDKRFVLDGMHVYGINRDNQLWRYHLQTEALTLLAELPQPIDYLTDIHQQQLLLTLLVAEKKEVIEVDLVQ